ncbi:MAG: phosphatidylglycerophosphatase A [Planctomycetaceae bacterium]
MADSESEHTPAEQQFEQPLAIADRLVLLLAEGLGLGRIRFAPGTWGSLWGVPLGWLLAEASPTTRLMIAGVMFVVGVPLCGRAALLRKTKDPGSVVWDEIAAFPIVYAFVPLSSGRLWPLLIAGFVLFRVFDIWKPPPVRHCDRLSGGFGIMIDDSVAAVYACLALMILNAAIS